MTIKKTMSHYDVLNAMLADNCPIEREDDKVSFEFALCCRTVRITANLISTVDTIQYEILDFEIL